MNLSSIIKESKAVQSGSFVKTVDEVLSLLCKEHKKTGRLTISERLVTLEPVGEGLVIGDLHGDLDSLLRILQKSGFT